MDPVLFASETWKDQHRLVLARILGELGSAPTMDVNANDTGFVPAKAGHYVENLAILKLCFWSCSRRARSWSLSQRVDSARPPEKLDKNTLQTIPTGKLEILPG
jgi:oxalate decarboxylase